MAPISTNQGGNVLTRYIPKGEARIPGYTGHVPARRVNVSGLGRTYGAATRDLLSPQKSVAGMSGTRTLALDTQTQQPRQVGRYTHPAVQPADMYKTGSNWDLAKAGHGADVKDTISGYSAHIPGVRDRIGGPGNQYFRGDKPGGMSVPQSSWRKGRARTEFRDATRLYDKPWLKNAASPGGKTSLETAWRPDPAVSPLKGGMSVSLAMGPKTDRSPWTHQKFPNEYVSQPGTASSQARADAVRIAGTQ